ncbi:hypothetical protein EV202_1535 [Bacteroides heparinolyticus]|uniref:Uncharacterized protein n=1 Tax=Prevotella heparinolytica TaxID=28113 RepID=A0A4R2LYP3_9BACE|nr:hypothetical protein [Bacteroides heparinolyticus]TCO85537.1 hypothetical protein EV202_1535 [Bacteroides heparinolyticus]
MERKIRQKIELDAKGKVELAKVFEVSVRNVCQALAFERNSLQAAKIREAAMVKGGRLLEINDVTDTARRPMKVLDAKGNVKAVLANDTVTL